MPTLPLFTPNDDPDPSHRVTAPGGYEYWHFDAESATGDVRLVATLGEGCPSDPGYWRRYLRYRRRPTRWPPPVPAEYPWAHVAVYEREKLLGQFTTVFPPTQFAASAHRPQVTAGANEFARKADGTLSLRLRGMPTGVSPRATSVDGAACLSAQLVFRPLLPHAPHEISLSRRRASTDAHFWVVANPLCEASGVISLTDDGNASAARGREIDFRGRGYHEHRYGTGPLGMAYRRSFKCRAIFGDVVVAFDFAQPLDPTCPDDARLLRFDADGLTQSAGGSVTVDWLERVRGPLTYPTRLACGTHLRLSDPRLIDRSASSVRLLYRAVAEGTPEGGTALCEVSATPTIGRGFPGAWLVNRIVWKRGAGVRP